MLPNVAILGAENARTRAYLDHLHRVGLEPSCCVLMTSPGPVAVAKARRTPLFDNEVGAAELAERAEVPTISVDAGDVNAPAVVELLSALKQDIVIFSGPSGAIVRERLFKTKKRFLHVHPGRLPEFRGSTTAYYSLLAKDEIVATALFLSPEIDAGPVLGQARYPPPEDRTTLDVIYDSWVRADLLVRVLGRYVESGHFEERAQSGRATTYFIVHPVLKHIAILSK